MTDKFPLVSVVIPTFNRVDYLKLTIESVISQTYKNIEVIVVDDGSDIEDSSLLCANYSQVQYYKIENSGGPAKPRNFGIDVSKGEYIAFVDDDDIWVFNKIEKQVSILEREQEFGLVHCYCELIDENSNHIPGVIGRPRNPMDKHGDVRDRMFGNWTVMMPTPLLRNEVIKNVGYFNESISAGLEDVEYWSRCAFYTNFYFIDEPLVKYRKHIGNISRENPAYIDLPLYLKKALVHEVEQHQLSITEKESLVEKILLMQAKSAKENFLRTIRNLFKIDSTWFLNFRVIKTIVKTLIK